MDENPQASKPRAEGTSPTVPSVSSPASPAGGDGLGQVEVDLEAETEVEPIGTPVLGDRIGGRYRLVSTIGSGGMGTVFRAEDEQLGRVVALKFLDAQKHGDADAVARFRREARALARLSHPGIVQAFDAGEDLGRPFLVMEFVVGEDLSMILKVSGPILPTLAADYIHQAAEALQHAHQAGLVHRDLKPSNLLLAHPRRIKVLDLGLARFLQDQLGDPAQTLQGMGMGTPDYMAPEQFRDAHSADPRSDVYALGCTLYHILTGVVPFPGSSLSEKAQAHLTEDPRPVEELCPHAPAGLSLAVGRMMAKRPAQRFQSMREVTEALAPYVASGSETVPRLRETTSWHGGQLAVAGRRRRRRWAVLAMLAVALVLLAAVLVVRDRRRDVSPATSPGLAGGRSKALPPWANLPAEPGVLTVAADGFGAYRTIREAVAAAGPGDSVRVIDEAAYRESIILDDPVRLAGLTLEAPRGATLIATLENPRPLLVLGVAGVTVRGFRFEGEEQVAPNVGSEKYKTFLTVTGAVGGLTLTHLEFRSDLKDPVSAIRLENVRISPAMPPVVVEGCTIHVGYDGVQVVGNSPDARAGRVVIRKNHIEGLRGVWLKGALEQVQVVGNIITDCTQAGLQLEDWVPGGRGILWANNSVVNCSMTMRVWEDVPIEDYGVGALELSNNVMRSTMGYSFEWIRQGESVADQNPEREWRLRDNWRDRDRGLPLGPDEHDISMAGINLLNPDRPDYLRPPRDSPLADQGAGRDDPSLPKYVGAIPPEGVAPWDWTRTWKARVGDDEAGGSPPGPGATP